MLASLVMAPAAFAVPAADGVVLDAPDSVETGDVIDVSITLSGGVDLYAYELDVAYDPLLVEYVPDSAVLPDGGFGDASDDGEGIAVVHTRLGTSPGLEGDIVLATLQFVAGEAGVVAFSPSSLAIVGADGEQGTIDLDAIDVEIVSVDDGGSGGTDPGSDPDDDTGGGTGGTDGTDDGTGTDPGDTDGDLAVTGIAMAGIVMAIILALASVGAGIMLLRRKARNA